MLDLTSRITLLCLTSVPLTLFSLGLCTFECFEKRFQLETHRRLRLLWLMIDVLRLACVLRLLLRVLLTRKRILAAVVIQVVG